MDYAKHGIPVRVSHAVWLALKKVRAHAPKRLSRSDGRLGALLNAMGSGDDELLALWRSVQSGKKTPHAYRHGHSVRVPRQVWLALKKVQAYAPDNFWPSTRTFGALLEAIGRGDDELLYMWREKMRER